jgi:hypothetical protein
MSLAFRFSRDCARLGSEQTANIRPTILEAAKTDVAVSSKVHFQVRVELDIPRMDLQAKPAEPRRSSRLHPPATGQHDALTRLSRPPSFAFAQLAAQPLELMRQKRIQVEARNAKSGRRQRPRRRA